MAVDPCTEYGLALALEDFVPVVLAGLGAVVLARACGRRHPSTWTVTLGGGVLITMAGLSKATWKLLVASEPCRNIDVLQQALFPGLCFGFAALSWGVASLRREEPVSPWPYALLPLLGAGSGLGLRSMAPLLAVAALGALWMGLNAVLHARATGQARVAALFVVYLLGTLVLPPLAGRPEQSATVQWVAQSTNTVIQLSFLVAALLLLRHTEAAAPTPVHQSTGAPT